MPFGRTACIEIHYSSVFGSESCVRKEIPTTPFGRGSVMSGNLDIDYSVRVDGILHGYRLATKRVLVVGLEGEVQAEIIEVEEAIIDGKVSGMLKASKEVSIGPRSQFRGRLETPRLIIEEGAVFQEEPEGE